MSGEPGITPWSGYRRLYRNGQTAARVTPDRWDSWRWSTWTPDGLLIESGTEPARLLWAPVEPSEVH